jgi:hypothetical protein
VRAARHHLAALIALPVALYGMVCHSARRTVRLAAGADAGALLA